MSNKESNPWPLWVGLIILALIAIAVIRIVVGGTIAFFQTEGIWKWLLVIIGLIVFVALVMNADRKA